MKRLKALVVEQDISFQNNLKELLSSLDFDVTLANTGQEGLAFAGSERFNLVCCSQRLPDILGYEFCGQVRALTNYSFCPVLILTLQETPLVFKQALLAGATDIFSKQDLSELTTYLQRFALRELRQVSGRVLLIEDSMVLQEIILDLLTDMGLDVDAYTYAESAWEAFKVGTYDLVITDIMLEGMMSGLALVRKLRRFDGKPGNVPIIATSGFDNVSRKIELFNLGVNDYIAKPIVREELRERVFNHIISYQKMLELRSQQNSLNSLAMLDELTQLFNRHALREFSGKYFSEAARFNRPLTLAVIDIDNFRNINDKQGHEKADQVLAELGTWLKRFARDEDMVARWSGEEFVFLIPNCSINEAETLMNNLQKRLALFKPANIEITVSIGLAAAACPEDLTLNSLFESADRAMYQAKMAGRNCVRVHKVEAY